MKSKLVFSLFLLTAASTQPINWFNRVPDVLPKAAVRRPYVPTIKTVVPEDAKAAVIKNYVKKSYRQSYVPMIKTVVPKDAKAAVQNTDLNMKNAYPAINSKDCRRVLNKFALQRIAQENAKAVRTVKFNNKPYYRK